MILGEIRVAPYSLRLRRPWHGAAGAMERRCGWLVVISGGGLNGYGDCAPPPSAPAVDIAASEVALRRLAGDLRGQSADAAFGLAADSGAPAPALCAFETALLDLQAQAAGLPLARLLRPQAAFRVRANASLGTLDLGAGQRARDALAAGYTVLKAKVGA
ncbi:MAG TPA: hypothetical protein VLC55_03340, partial [Burkholderiales bacterium]|nr:hypothetical protein [Burkholderiales bacterium]